MMHKYTKSWLTGYALRLCCELMTTAGSKKEPVAYLYNGVRLPVLPVWNKESYPNTVVVSHNDTKYSFVVTQVEVVVSPNGYTLKHPAGSLTPFNYGGTKLIEADAENWGEVTYDSVSLYSGRVIWANFDIQDDEGNTYIVASSPVPVYE